MHIDRLLENFADLLFFVRSNHPDFLGSVVDFNPFARVLVVQADGLEQIVVRRPVWSFLFLLNERALHLATYRVI